MTQQDTGFYARTPRIVRTEYKNLLASEKWLYTCLKDLCGDKGTCFRSLRSLSTETDLSLGSLSKMIPHLHEAGLIHAEKKSRGAGGREVWHISIVDIWQANAEYCSQTEHVHTAVVQKMNRVVQDMNRNSKSCSENEPSCSEFDDRRINNEEEYNRRRKGEEEKNDTPLSCSLSLSAETESQEHVTTGTGSEQNTGAETPSTDKTDELPETKNPFQVLVSEKKTPPTWIKPLSSVRTTQYKMPDRLFVQPKEEQEQVPEPRPLTKNEQRKVDEAEAEDYWSVAEEVLQTTYPYGVRNSPANSHGLLGIIGERRYSRADIKLGFERLDNFQIKTFTWEKFHLWLPGLLSGKYEQQQKNGGQPTKQVVYPSRPIETIPPTGGGWGRRLDGGNGIMPGVGRVRHD